MVLRPRNRRSCKVVYKELRSVNTSEAGCIAVLPVCALFPYRKELKENSMGLSLGCLSIPEFLLLGDRTATRLRPVCFRLVCEKRRRGVWDCVCLCAEAEAKEGGFV